MRKCGPDTQRATSVVREVGTGTLPARRYKANSSPKFRSLSSACAAAAVALLALACGSDPEAGMMPPAQVPAPVPTQVVQLGAFGGSITLASTGAGGWTLNGQPFSSNTEVSGGNGLSYLLTLAGGTWTAEFVAGDPFAVALGMSGEEILLHLQEDSTYLLDGTPVTMGRLVADSNGDEYVLGLGPDGTWQASFVVRSVSVQLGDFGGFAILSSDLGGVWTYRGVPFYSGQIITAGNGFDYLLRLGPDGQWTAQALGRAFPIPVSGPNQAPLALTGLEDGRYFFNDLRVVDGEIITRSNGNRYELSFDGSSWTARLLSGEFQVPIEDGYFLAFRQDEAGRVRYVDPGIEDPRDIMDGDVVQSTVTDRSYVITVGGEVWAAALVDRPGGAGSVPDPAPDPPEPMDPTPPDPPEPMDPDPMTPDPSPSDPDPMLPPAVPVDPLILYEVPREATNFLRAQNNGQLAVAGLQAAPTSTAIDGVNYLMETIDYGAYSGRGRHQTTKFTDEVAASIDLILGPIDAGTATADAEQDALIVRYLNTVQGAMDAVFGAGQVTFERTAGNLASDIQQLRQWRSIFTTRASFKSVLSDQIAAATSADADATGDAIFDATRFLAMASTENTIHGTYSSKGGTAAEVAGGDAELVRVHFAVSYLNTSATALLPTSGVARYRGSTWAVSDTQVAYSGQIDLRVSLASFRINGTISNLQDTASNAPWAFGAHTVGRIELPTIHPTDYPNQFGAFFETPRQLAADQSNLRSVNIIYTDPTVAPTTSGHAWVLGRFAGRSVGGPVPDPPGTQDGVGLYGAWFTGESVSGSLSGSFGSEFVGVDQLEDVEGEFPVLPGVELADGTIPPGAVNDRYDLGGSADNVVRDSDSTLTTGSPPSVRVGDQSDQGSGFGTAAGFAAAHTDNYLTDRSDSRTNPALPPAGRPLNNIRFTSTDYSHLAVWSLEFHDPASLSLGSGQTATALPNGKSPGDLITNDFYLADDGTTQLFDGPTGFVAYSWLPDASFETRDVENFPGRLTATYTGKALMVDTLADVTLYQGEYQASVSWGGFGSSATTTITATLSNFTGYQLNGRDLGDLTFTHSFEPIGTSGCGVCFDAVGAQAGAALEYSNGDSIALTQSESSHRGQFAGESIEGPLTLFGAWSVAGSGFALEGPFGANLWGHDPPGGATVP